MKKLLAGIATFLILGMFAHPCYPSQNAISIPFTPPLSGTALVTYINDANNTLATNFSGTSAPGTPLTGQFWLDTTTSNLKIYDGTGFRIIGSYAGSNFTVPATSGGTGLNSGTSGGVPYFNSGTTIASSAALTANLPVIGGGAGAAPSVGTRSGNTTAFVTTTGAQTSGRCVEIDASGNHIAAAAACSSGGGGTPGGSTDDMQYNAGSGTFGGITLTNGQLVVGQTASTPLAKTVSGDATLAASGALTVASIGGKAITLANSFTTAGNFALTLTQTGATNVTLPTTGTLATLAGSEALTNKSLNGMTVTASTGTFTLTNAKTFAVSNSLTLTATDGSTLAIGAGGTLGTAAYTAATAYEVPLTFSTGLTRSTNTITVNTSQNIATLSNLTSNGLVTTSGGTGALSITVPASGMLTFIATPSSANLAATITNETGSGLLPFATSPTLTEPLLASGVFDSPQGRLTLTSGVPVQRANATAQTSIYYTPYRGTHVPIYDGTNFVLKAFTELTLALDSNSGHTGYQQSGKNFDLFVINDSGTIRLCTGPAWTNDTARANAISQVNGIWVNTAGSLTCRFGSASGNTVTVSASQGTYVGTMRATADGQTGMNFIPAGAAGGNNNILGLYNAYNRTFVQARCMDSTASWTDNGGVFNAVNNSNSNRISWVDGLQQSSIEARYYAIYQSNGNGFTAVGLDSTSTADGMNSYQAVNVPFAQPAGTVVLPQIGFHYIQALELGPAGGATFTGNGGQALFVQLEM